MKVFAHRGNSAHYLENTYQAFKSCVELGISGIELDVQLTKDNQVVIFHDELLDRLLPLTGYLKDYTLAELREYSYADGQQIVTLAEYLQLIDRSDIITNVELKNSVVSYHGLEEKVYQLFKQYRRLDKLLISSFNHNSLLVMKQIDANIKVGALMDCAIIDVVKYLRHYQIDAWHPNFTLVSDELVAQCHQEGIAINVWTVNSQLDYELMLKKQVDIVITNYPDLNFKV